MGIKRQQEWSSTCSVVLVGDARVGKTALVNRVLADKFTEVRRNH
jgi:GTPase SAR1 family protein